MRYLGRKLKIMKGVGILLKSFRYLPKFFFTLLRSKTLIDYKLFNNGFSFYPAHIVWETTNRCNLRCRTCWLWGDHGIGKSFLDEELTFEEVKKVIDDISSFKPIIYFTGGEPLIRDDITETIRYVKNKGLICTLTTNGTLISSELASSIVNSGLDVISFSLDGPKEINDKIRGRGVFEKVMKSIKLIAKERGKKMIPIIKISTTISNLNYDKLLEVASISEKICVDELQFQHLWFTDEDHAESHKKVIGKLFGISTTGIDGYVTNLNIDTNVLNEQISRIKSLKGSIDISFYPHLQGREALENFYKDTSFTFKNKCVNPWFSVTIKPDGNVVPCPDYYIPEYVIGNVKKESFSSIWNNEKAKLFRKTLKRCGYFPGCVRCCGLFNK